MSDQQDYNKWALLSRKLLDGTITAIEKEELFEWLNHSGRQPLYIPDSFADNHDELRDRMHHNLLTEIEEESKLNVVPLHPGRKWYRFAAAAVIMLLLGSGIYFWLQNTPKQVIAGNPTQLPTDISPGREGAILTLANGTQVVLDSLGNGTIATQNGAEVVLSDGQLAYDAIAGGAENEITYNTMRTPKGRQFKVILHDGTQVWLNSGSSIRYPVAFTGKERKVKITGEAYFEVAKNPRMPFLVNVNNRAEVQVLGTHFNINAYDNEKLLRTTLLEGSVKINGTPIEPGQQAIITNAAGSYDQHSVPSLPMRIINDTDLEKVMAWKNGAFSFEGLSLDEAMRQLERWYNIDVVYENGVPEVNLGGKIGRDVSLAGLLKMLAGAKLKFRIEDNRTLVILK